MDRTASKWASLKRILGTPQVTGAAGVLVVLSLALSTAAVGRAASSEATLDATTAELEGLRTDLEGLRADFAELGNGVVDVLGPALDLQSNLQAVVPQIRRDLATAAGRLDELRSGSLTFDVAVQDTVPIDTEFTIRRTIEIPIDTSIPIDETIDTTISVDGPFGLRIPIGVTVPIALDVPVLLTLPLTIDEAFPVTTDIDLDLAVPVSVDVAQTELVSLIDGLQTMLDAIVEVIDALGN